MSEGNTSEVKMSESKQLTIKDIIAKKKEKKANETKQLFVPSLEGNITIAKPTRREVLNALDMSDGEGDLYIIYQCVIDPNIKDQSVREDDKVVFEPYKVVEDIFDVGEIIQITQEIAKMVGFHGGVIEIKN